MSQQERGRAPVAAAATLVALVMVCHCHVAHSKSTNYVVGDGKNGSNRFWSIILPPYVYYPSGVKGLKVKDTLEFKYTKGVHNVVRVDSHGYNDCKASSSKISTEYKTGDDKIQLVLGPNYFINGKNFDASKKFGMKIMVTAAK